MCHLPKPNLQYSEILTICLDYLQKKNGFSDKKINSSVGKSQPEIWSMFRWRVNFQITKSAWLKALPPLKVLQTIQNLIYTCHTLLHTWSSQKHYMLDIFKHKNSKLQIFWIHAENIVLAISHLKMIYVYTYWFEFGSTE